MPESNAAEKLLVAPRRRALGDRRHQRGCFRASTLAKASLRMDADADIVIFTAVIASS
jgi:hypothetical protein